MLSFTRLKWSPSPVTTPSTLSFPTAVTSGMATTTLRLVTTCYCPVLSRSLIRLWTQWLSSIPRYDHQSSEQDSIHQVLYDPQIYEQLLRGGVDKLMAQHVAHLFIRFNCTFHIVWVIIVSFNFASTMPCIISFTIHRNDIFAQLVVAEVMSDTHAKNVIQSKCQLIFPI